MNINPDDLYEASLENLEILFDFIKNHPEDQEKFLIWKEYKFEIKDSSQLELPKFPRDLPIYKKN